MRLLLVALTALSMTLSGCATVVGGPLEGSVIDATTGKPIPGAFAIAVTYLRGADLVGSRSSCRDLDVSVTDSRGMYRLSRGTAFGNVDRTVMVYSPGYVDADGPQQRQSSPTRLTPYQGSGDARFSSFTRYSTLVTCGPIEEVVPKLAPLFSALDSEYATLSLTDRFGPPNPFTAILDRNRRRGVAK